jgi:hypothetical protein
MKRLITICLVVLLMTCTQTSATTSMEAAQKAADYLAGIQLSNGGWGWYNSDTVATNITGATGIGLVRYYQAAGGSTYLDSAKAAGNYLKDYATFPSPKQDKTWFATYDPYYCWQLSVASGDNTWSDLAATEFFDELTAGTYGTSNRDTANWIAYVQTARSGSLINMRPWEFSTIAVTAKNIGNTGQEASFTQAILDGLNTLGGTDDWLGGVAGGVRGLALDGVTSFTAINSPNNVSINGISTLVGLADYLAGKQNADGSWYWGENITSPSESDKDTQVTAYAVLALEAAKQALGTSSYNDELALGRNWLITMQVDSGTYAGAFLEYPGYTGTTYCNELAGEALAALIPEPATIVLLGLGVLGLLKKRRA